MVGVSKLFQNNKAGIERHLPFFFYGAKIEFYWFKWFW